MPTELPTVTWLAFWHDPISPKDFKYVWLAANSTFKTESDLAKYEKARLLKQYIDDIRKQYRRDWDNKAERRTRQMGACGWTGNQLPVASLSCLSLRFCNSFGAWSL